MKIKKFYNSNKRLTQVSIASLIIYMSYQVTMDLPEIIPYGDLIYNFFSELSLAFMGGFIFYILQVYIPEENKKDHIVESLSYHLKNLISELDELNAIQRNTSIFSKSPLINNINGNYIDYCDYFDYIKYKIDMVNRSCDIIYKNFIYLDDDLIVIINKLYNSEYVKNFLAMYSARKIVDKSVQVKNAINLDGYCSDLEYLKSYL